MKYLFSFCWLLSLASSSDAQVKYTSAGNEWKADSLGNIRAVVEFTGTGTGTGPIARVIIPWRRSDTHPENKRIIIEDAKTRQLITNFHVGMIDNEKGDISFEPLSGKGLYNIYYMPYKNEGRSNYPKGVYLSPVPASSSGTTSGSGSSPDSGTPPATPNAFTREIQSIDAFNSPFPMEVIATTAETTALIKKSGRTDYLVFPEDRRYPIKMNDRLPYRWIQKGILYSFTDTVAKGENYSWQLGICALQSIPDITLQFSDCKDAQGHSIPHENFYCFNSNGTDYEGKPFTKNVSIEAGKVQSLWCGADIPASIPAGTYHGSVKVQAAGMPPTSIAITLRIKDSTETDGGISQPWLQTRLKWLNSTLMQDNTVIAPYTPLTTGPNTVTMLGRELTIGFDGLPQQIATFFTPEMTGYTTQPNNLLNQPIHFNISDAAGQPIPLVAKGWSFTKKEAGTVEWTGTNIIGSRSALVLQMDLHARLEFDGYLQYQVRITALDDIQLSDIFLLMPFKKDNARYMMGLGQKGGYTPSSFDWKWQVATKNQDGAWIGSVNAGLQFSLRDQHYVRPLNTNFYLQKPLLLPTSWGNDNKGGVNISSRDSTTIVRPFSGSRTMKKGDTLYYNFTFLITPFHPINTDFQWATRFYHRYNDIDSIRNTGATVINIHHATPINPWINYPFIEYKKMKAYIDEAHAKGLKVKIYNTVRELSDRAYELFPMRSLGHEIYSPGKGGGFSWLQEHVKDDYIPAWFVPEIKDAALVNSGMSRWHNYYVEGMNWLVQNVGIDGIYLDDVAFDRITMKRIKRVLTRDGHPGIIDLHSANQYNKNDGFNNSANLYMEHFPYLSRLWFGEYFDYQKNDPAFFLTEVSGIPFGLMGEMLQDGGNAWRGMIYGMTNRLPWSEGADPRPIWKTWDTFGMEGSEMIGYWSGHCPVTTSDPLVLATVYRKKGDQPGHASALIAIASWAAADTTVQLSIDWQRLGIDPAKAVITIPEIMNFQSAVASPTTTIPVQKGKGLILIIKAN